MSQQSPVRIAIFASGKGSNAKQLMSYFQESQEVEVSLLVSNRLSSGIFQSGPSFGVPTHLLPGTYHRDGKYLVELMRAYQIRVLVLAGYLKLIPADFVHAFPNRIINIHPSLLPKHGGKGMYGAKVHQAVLDQGDEESGITIHFVNEVYDQGKVIFQKSLPVDSNWNASQLQSAIHQLEYDHFPQEVEKVCREILLEKDMS